MCARTPFWQTGNSLARLFSLTLSMLLPLVSLPFTGCSDSKPLELSELTTDPGTIITESEKAESVPAEQASQVGTSQKSSREQTPALQDSASATGTQFSSGADGSVTGLSLENPSENQRTAISPNRSPKQLRKLLSDIDYNLRVLMSGQSPISDPKQARSKMLEYINLKLEASRRLATHEDASLTEKSEGARGEIQAMSHLASVGNVGAATELEKVAKENLSSDDPGLASDSRLILIGFALEDLKNGKKEAAQTIVNYFQQIETTKAKPDVPTLMIMGMAREDLASGGYDQQAQLVREMILDFYADSPDPAIAEMAANAAGNVTFETIEKQRAALTSGVPDTVQVTVEQWSKSVETLIAESPDLQTAQYLAAAALEFEGLKREDLVKATYEALGNAFTDPSSAINKEVSLAQEARQTRKDVIGKAFDWDLPTTDGKKLQISDFSGKIVLMPFWAAAFPSSLSIVPQLKAICAKHPDQVVIVGVNLDPEGADVQSFINKSQLGFISLRSESLQNREISNQIAHDFGMVSLPFVAILDKKGLVQDLNFTGQKLEKQVTHLLSQ
jgi:hypothetical protein